MNSDISVADILRYPQTPLGKVYQEDYFRDELFQAAKYLLDAAEKEGLTAHAVALRWIMYHSALSSEHGDAVIIGASSLRQALQNLEIFDDGPLSDSLVKEIENVWQMAKGAAPAYHR